MAIGCKVTLRGEKMYEFADRLINLALPRVRDFRGVNPVSYTHLNNLLLVKGAVPGPKKSLVTIKESVKSL